MRTNTCYCEYEKRHERETRENERLRKENQRLRQELEEAKIQIKALSQYIVAQESKDEWEI